ncbi:amidohydrolase [Nocardioides caldifontis]|uniref:amidohydrolase n=1 Tax=Nocardioides caldifontis TaxID=2588938 RepID=UPI0011DF56E9|nr:amidohydrolase [Nocardioides caldifontis]
MTETTSQTVSQQPLTRRHVLAGAAATGAVTAAGLVSAGPVAAKPKVADTIVVGAKVLLMDKRFRQEEAIAIRDGRVMAVGSRREIKRLAGRRTEVIHAGGGTVLPGINDSHLHLGSLALTVPPLSYNVDTATIPELVEVVRQAVEASSSPTAWIRGQGWNDNRLPKAPDRHDLDAVSGDHPVILTDFSFHAIAVNTKALELAGITRDTEPPTGGVIERDGNGDPTGVLRETAQGLVQSVVPPFTEAQVSEGIDASVAALHALGITSVTDPGIGLDALVRYARKHRRGELPLRLNLLLSGGNSVRSMRQVIDGYEPLRRVDPTFLRVAGVKIFADGIPTAAQTAWLRRPYLDGTNGSLVTAGATVEEQVETLHRMIRIAVRHGFQVGTHATGDATIDAVVDGYIEAMGRNWRKADLRHYVIHGDLTPKRTLRRMARHDIGVNMNGTIKFLLGRTLDPVLGPERTDYQWPYRSALQAGVRVSSSSDAPVTQPSWLQGVMAMRLREGMFGGVAGRAERISVRQALATYTRTPAWQDHAAGYKGTLRPGRVADLCIVDGDVLGVDPHELVDLQVAATLVAGKVVHDGTSSSSRTRASNVAAGISTHSAGACLEQGLCCCGLSERLQA